MRRATFLLWSLLACDKHTAIAKHDAPSHVDHPVPESELPIVTLRKEASVRLGITHAEVRAFDIPETRLVGGEVIVPPGRTLLIAAPVSGELREVSTSLIPGARVARGDVLYRLLPFAPADRDLAARATREVAAAAAQLQAAEGRVTRLSQVGADKVVAKRAYEDAVAARDTLRADLQVAQSRAQSLHNAPLLADVALAIRAPTSGVIRTLAAPAGQAVAAGTTLLELVQVDSLQVRVPVYAGDLARVDAASPANVRGLTSTLDEGVAASVVAGPPTSTPDRATVDRYFALPAGSSFVPGQRVLVDLPLHGEQKARGLPRSSVVYDAQGIAWVYACAGELRYRRERIDPSRLEGETVVFTRGPSVSQCIASTGAAEIFGAEFEPGH